MIYVKIIYNIGTVMLLNKWSPPLYMFEKNIILEEV